MAAVKKASGSRAKVFMRAQKLLLPSQGCMESADCRSGSRSRQAAPAKERLACAPQPTDRPLTFSGDSTTYGPIPPGPAAEAYCELKTGSAQGTDETRDATLHRRSPTRRQKAERGRPALAAASAVCGKNPNATGRGDSFLARPRSSSKGGRSAMGAHSGASHRTRRRPRVSGSRAPDRAPPTRAAPWIEKSPPLSRERSQGAARTAAARPRSPPAEAHSRTRHCGDREHDQAGPRPAVCERPDDALWQEPRL